MFIIAQSRKNNTKSCKKRLTSLKSTTIFLSMKYEKLDQKSIITVKININDEVKNIAKSFAKRHKYSFQDWLGILVEEELQKNGVLENKTDTT